MTITATIIADSISPSGKRITTFELEYPRFIHGEVMTHRVLSRNSSSSRAVPIPKAVDHVRNNPVYPIEYGANQAGMTSGTMLSSAKQAIAKAIWGSAMYAATSAALLLHKAGLHKQWTGRLIEPFQLHKIVMTSTELDNFFYLRDHSDAQPEIQDLAQKMIEAIRFSTPMQLFPGEYHVPYVDVKRDSNDKLCYYSNDQEISLEDALKISASCCGQVSYRVLNQSMDKALDIYKRLVESKPVHASPFEHQATPMADDHNLSTPGITGYNGNEYSSGNFNKWIQHRQLIPNHVYIKE
jgi:hypothetical protein